MTGRDIEKFLEPLLALNPVYMPSAISSITMVLNKLPFRPNTLSIASRGIRSCLKPSARYVSTETPSSDSAPPISTSNIELELDDTEFTNSSSAPTADIISSYDPVRSSIARRAKLPSSRYVIPTDSSTQQLTNAFPKLSIPLTTLLSRPAQPPSTTSPFKPSSPRLYPRTLLPSTPLPNLR